MLLLYLITTHLLPSLDPIVNFKASGCEHKRLLFECSDISPSICLICGEMSPHIRDSRQAWHSSTSSIITLWCCDIRSQDAVGFFPSLWSLFHRILFSIYKCCVSFNVVFAKWFGCKDYNLQQVSNVSTSKISQFRF